jgi:hypothetical protein
LAEHQGALWRVVFFDFCQAWQLFCVADDDDSPGSKDPGRDPDCCDDPYQEEAFPRNVRTFPSKVSWGHWLSLQYVLERLKCGAQAFLDFLKERVRVSDGQKVRLERGWRRKKAVF